MKTIKEIKEEIKELKAQGKLYKRVINDILEDSKNYNGNFTERLQSRIEDIQHSGCQSGTVSMLIYYEDTVKFFKYYQDEIEELLKELMQDTGLNIAELFGANFDNDDIFCREQQNQNLLAWFAYEEITNKLSYILED